MVFKKGQIANPKGRRAETAKVHKHIKELLMHLSPRVAEELEEMLDNPIFKEFAIKTILERVYGKPPQEIDLAGKDGGPIQAIIEIVNARK